VRAWDAANRAAIPRPFSFGAETAGMTTATRTLTARRTSLWSATGSVPHPGPLTEDLQVDVCVIGAGIAGLTTAYLLSRYGKLVAVLDDGPIAGGQHLPHHRPSDRGSGHPLPRAGAAPRDRGDAGRGPEPQ
jgi:NADPH-dependent 2,4-dienoyl-CoA reductase/sulfur reductase-like enzyme